MKQTLAGGEGFTVVEVVWDDALAGSLEWTEKATTHTMETTSVGYLIHQDETSITLASLINKTHIGHTITIPRGCVRWMTEWGTV